MLDLPLRPGGRQSDLPFGPDRLRPDKPAGPPASGPTRRHPPTPRKRGRWGWIAAVIVVLLGLAYLILWPKPPAPSFSEDPFVVEKVRVGESGELQTLTIRNVGERPMPIGVLSLVGEDAGEFTMEEDGCGNRLLQPQGDCTVQLRFVPQAMGRRQTWLELQAEMPESPARLAVSGEGTAPVMALDPAGGSFGPQDVGTMSDPLDLMVRNQGTAALRISRVALGGVAERDFRLTRNDCSKATLEPGQTCALRLVFVPRAAGQRQAEVVLDSDALEPVPTIELTGEGIWTGAAFAVEPRSVDFGRHLVGTGAARQKVQVINRQGARLRDIRVVLADADRGFRVVKQSCTEGGLAPGESCQVEVGFAPTGEGDFDSLLEISQADVGTLGIELRGQGVAPRWVLGAPTLEFGDLRVEETGSARQAELRNEGSAAAKVTQIELEGADAVGFKIAGDRCSGQNVMPDSGCTVQIRFEPRREGAHVAELVLRVAAGPTPQRVSLQGRAVAARLSLDREMVDFDRVHRTTLRQVELSLSNRGTAGLKLGPIDIADDTDGDFSLVSGSCMGMEALPAGQRCTVNIAFRPLAEGRATARLRIEHDGISGPREVPLAGIGLPPPIPKLIVEQQAVEFGPQPVGNRSTIQTVNLRAGGTGNLDLREFTLEGPDAGDFSIVPATCHAGPQLQPGTACAVGLRFIPKAAGRRSAWLVLRHNAGSGIDRIELRGEGLGGPPG